jgi:hypothetical protein
MGTLPPEQPEGKREVQVLVPLEQAVQEPQEVQGLDKVIIHRLELLPPLVPLQYQK